MAKAKRTNESGLESQNALMGGLMLENENNETLKVEDQSIFGSSVDLHPIIFEECYVKDQNPKFIQLVKTANEVLTEEQIMPTRQPSGRPVSTAIGVHLFILVHGFQGN